MKGIRINTVTSMTRLYPKLLNLLNIFEKYQVEFITIQWFWKILSQTLVFWQSIYIHTQKRNHINAKWVTRTFHEKLILRTKWSHILGKNSYQWFLFLFITIWWKMTMKFNLHILHFGYFCVLYCIQILLLWGGQCLHPPVYQSGYQCV